MYILGYHGCDKTVGLNVLNQRIKNLNKSENAYDWLGNGIYFWENSPLRALEWAKKLKENGKPIQEPFVIGAIIELNHCLNLNDFQHLLLIKEAYSKYIEICKMSGADVLENKGGRDLLQSSSFGFQKV